MDVPKTGRRLVNLRGPILHLAAEFKGVAQRGFLANLVHRVVTTQASSGLDVRVVIPGSPELNRASIAGTQDKGDYLQGTVEGVPIYVIKDAFPAIYPAADNGEPLKNYLGFSQAFWSMVGKGLFNYAIDNSRPLVHLWDHVMGWVLTQRPFELGSIRTIFTPVEPATTLEAFGAEEAKALAQSTFGGMVESSAFRHERVSGFMVGLEKAELVTEWQHGFLRELITGQTPLGAFLHPLLKKGHVVSLNSHGWRPAQQTDIPTECIDNFEAVALEALFGKGHRFSLKLMELHKRGMWTPAGTLINIVHRKHEERAPLIMQEMTKLGIPPTEVIERYKHGMKYQNNVGGLLEMSTRLPETPKGTYLFMLAAGPGTRSGIVSLSFGAMKNRMPLVAKQITKLTLEEAAQVGMQLPGMGEGWVIYFGNDNILVADGALRIGKHLAGRAKQKILLVGQPIEVRRARMADINKLKGLGIYITDPSTGEVIVFLEKVVKETADAEGKAGDFDRTRVVTTYLDPIGSDQVMQNTFFMAMTQEMAKLFNDADHYSKLTKKNGKPFHETYSIDWSKHFVEPATIEDLDVWMKKYDDDAKKMPGERAKTKISDVFDRDDWEALWHIAHDLKDKAGGIGGVSIGRDGKWCDVGTNEELLDTNLGIFAPGEEQELWRKLFDVPENTYVRESHVKDVEFADPQSAYVDNSLFEQGGKVGKMVIIVDTIFEKRIEIPDNTIVYRGRFYKIEVSKASRSVGTLIYNVRLEPHQEFSIADNTAYGTAFLHDKPPLRGQHSITHYEKERPIDGVGLAVEDAKNIVSLENTRQAEEDHLALLEMRLHFKGTETRTF